MSYVLAFIGSVIIIGGLFVFFNALEFYRRRGRRKSPVPYHREPRILAVSPVEPEDD